MWVKCLHNNSGYNNDFTNSYLTLKRWQIFKFELIFGLEIWLHEKLYGKTWAYECLIHHLCVDVIIQFAYNQITVIVGQ